MDFIMSDLLAAIVGITLILVNLTAIAAVLFSLKLIKNMLGTRAARMSVYSMEQMMKSGNGAIKKKLAGDLLKRRLGFVYSTEEINHLIESAVFEMNMNYNKLGEKTAISSGAKTSSVKSSSGEGEKGLES
jgi:hypothetical protein